MVVVCKCHGSGGITATLITTDSCVAHVGLFCLWTMVLVVLVVVLLVMVGEVVNVGGGLGIGGNNVMVVFALFVWDWIVS